MSAALLKAKELILNSNNIILIAGSNSDSFFAALALFYTLQKLNKTSKLYYQRKPEYLKYLHQNIDYQEFVLEVNANHKQFEKLRYEKNEHSLKLYFTLSKGWLSLSDVFIYPSAYQPQKTDLIITIGIKSRSDLMLHHNLKKSSAVYLLNINCGQLNENFGDINLIDHQSICVSEIIIELIRKIDDSLLADQQATCLLAGLILGTLNFQHPNTNSKILNQTALLIERGAEHNKIIKELYKTKSLPQLKLLGRTLQKFLFLPQKELGLITLSEKDFMESETTSKDIASIVKDIKFNFPQLPSLIVLWESHSSPPIVKGVATSKNKALIQKVLSNFNGIAKENNALFVIKEADLQKAKEILLEAI